MKNNRKDIELMSPVGSFASLTAAIQGGANAVYFGIDQLNMRARALNNFTIDDLPRIREICQSNNIKTYLTLNTVIYDSEIKQADRIIDAAKANEISAIIAMDHAVIQRAFQKGVEVHISTQTNISNIESLKFYANYADVMVLARELNLDQIWAINKEIEQQQIKGPSGNLIRTELFIHGALCMSISGKCYLSLHNHMASANRGECLQDCRRVYYVKDRESGIELDIENEHIMSPKDLCTIGFLNKIIDAGVKVLKIEGRARSPEYVKIVTSCYSEALESYFNNTYSESKIEDWRTRISSVFNRGFWDGYYLGKKLGEWSNVYGSSATRRKVYLAKVTNYFSNIKVAELLIETGELKIDDEVFIIGPSTGVVESKISEIRVDNQQVESVKKGTRFSIPSETLLRRSDKLYKLVDVKRTSLMR